MRLVTVVSIVTALLTICCAKYPPPHWRNVAGLRKVRFKYDEDVSDEFRGKRLDESKWDPHGLRNQNSGCSKWNGPVDWVEPIFSTYHATTTQLNGKKVRPRKRQYRIQRGELRIRVTAEPRRYFTSREYYCNRKTFHCNHNKRIPCYGTTYNGDPILKDPSDPLSYKYIVHDKCKIEPFCIPHPVEVVGSSRKYQKYLGVNLVGKTLFKYGYFEARVLVADTPAVSAVWMHDDNTVPGYSRWIKLPNGYYMIESPTSIRSRRWQEIDILEAMNAHADELSTKYIPNIHLFAAYKGEFTARKPPRRKLGEIILDRSVFTQRNPVFNPPDPDRANEYHLNYGSSARLSRPWASEWHTVGMYWSPREIRFLLDGEETLRLRNTLAHQPMFYTIGTGLNKQWAQQAPTRRQLGRWTRIDYVRRWTVRTKGGKDPPSNLPLSKTMPRHFKKLGTKYLAVDGIFPVKDDGKTIPNPAVRFLGSLLTNLPKSPFAGGSNLLSNTAENQKSGSPDEREGDEDEDEMADPSPLPPDFWDNPADGALNVSQLLPAGGLGNSLWTTESGRKRRFTPEERRGAETRQDRLREPDVFPRCDREGSQTAFEDANPEVNLAGWATRDGTGADAGVIPSGQCA